MNNLIGNLNGGLFNSDLFCNGIFGNLDINKLLVILLLLTDQLDIEAIHVYKNNFVVSLGTFTQD